MADLIHRPAAVIVGNNISAIIARHATTTVPIVFVTGGGPVRNGIVANLSRPGGNVTGMSFFGAVGVKRFELLRQLAPKAATIAMLINPGLPDAEAEQRKCRLRRKRSGNNSLISMPAAIRDRDRLWYYGSTQGRCVARWPWRVL